MEQLNSFWIWSAIVIISSNAGVFILSGTLIIYWCSVLALTVFQRVILALWWWWDTEWSEDRAVAAGAGWWPGRLPVEVWNQLLPSWGSTEEEEGRQRWNKWMRVQLWEGPHLSGESFIVHYHSCWPLMPRYRKLWEKFLVSNSFSCFNISPIELARIRVCFCR